MRIYLAAAYGRKEEIRRRAYELSRVGLQVTSSWLDEPHPSGTGLGELQDFEHAKYAAQDLDDIRKSDFLVFFSEHALTPRGGRHVEFGYALALGKVIVVIGPRENIFHYLPQIIHFPTWAEAHHFLVGENSAGVAI